MLATSSMNNKERDYKAYRSIPSNYKYYPRQNPPRKLAKPQKENQAAFNKTGTRHIKTKTMRPHNREPNIIINTTAKANDTTDILQTFR